jgi:hypothetical protein
VVHIDIAMNDLRNLAAFTLLLPLSVGCAGRTAPFNEMDQAQITVMRLSPPPAPAPAVGQPGAPLIPGIPPEIQQMGQQILQGAQQVLPPGLIPPGLIPGQQAAPQQPPPPMWKGYAITAQQPLTDDKLKDELLDIFGSEDSFSGQRGNCFMPGMGVTLARSNAPPVELLISLSCNQAQGDGFRWPYPNNGFTTETHERLSKIYQSLWGPVPPGA